MGIRAPLALANVANQIRRHSGDAYGTSHKLLSGAYLLSRSALQSCLLYCLLWSHGMARIVSDQGGVPCVPAPATLETWFPTQTKYSRGSQLWCIPEGAWKNGLSTKVIRVNKGRRWCMQASKAHRCLGAKRPGLRRLQRALAISGQTQEQRGGLHLVLRRRTSCAGLCHCRAGQTLRGGSESSNLLRRHRAHSCCSGQGTQAPPAKRPPSTTWSRMPVSRLMVLMQQSSHQQQCLCQDTSRLASRWPWPFQPAGLSCPKWTPRPCQST